MSRNFHDALIEQLLREQLGGDRPRDLTARVLARAKLHDRVQRQWWLGTASAIAAMLVLCATLWIVWPRQATQFVEPDYPEPQVVEGTAFTHDGGALVRGVPIETNGDESATLDLGGGFVKLVMAPDTALTLGGKRLNEQVLLDRGAIDVNVAKKKGSFDVLVGPATVHVVGTDFSVEVENAVSEDEIGKNLTVTVAEGSVLLRMPGLQRELAAGDSETRFIPLRTKPIPIRTKIIEPNAGNDTISQLTHTAPSTSPTTASSIEQRNSTTETKGTARGPGAGRGDGPLNPGRSNTANRGATSGTPRPAATKPAATRPAKSEPALNMKTLQMISPTGKLELMGLLLKEQDYILLQTPRGTVILFPIQNPPTGFSTVNIGKRVRVIWGENGKLKTIEPLTTARGDR